MKFILGKKIDMKQLWNDAGVSAAVTKVHVEPCVVTQVKTHDKDGYNAVQIGVGKKKRLTKPQRGHLKNLGDFSVLREFRISDVSEFEPGHEITLLQFEPGDIVDVAAISKGRGFQGVVKRHGFHGSPASHGHKDQLRMPGSIGSTDAARVFKGKRMAGRMGGERVTVKNVEVVAVDAEKNILSLKGSVPGARNGLVMIKESQKFSEKSQN